MEVLACLLSTLKLSRQTSVRELNPVVLFCRESMTSVQENFAYVKTSALVASLWLRIRPIIDERLAVIERAAAAATAGTLDVDTREEAADVAHKLAGSLGMYGYERGTRMARQLELLLDYSDPDPDELNELALALRQALTDPNPN